MNVPYWLQEDINKLRLNDVRLSRAIYELYNHYTNSHHKDLSLGETMKLLTLENQRLDWIDKNIEVIEYAINTY